MLRAIRLKVRSPGQRSGVLLISETSTLKVEIAERVSSQRIFEGDYFDRRWVAYVRSSAAEHDDEYETAATVHAGCRMALRSGGEAKTAPTETECPTP